MTVKQVYGYVSKEGEIKGGEDTLFSVEQRGPGYYVIWFSEGFFEETPIVNVTLVSPYITANAALKGFDNTGFAVRTGYTDKDSTEYMDASFTFMAIGK